VALARSRNAYEIRSFSGFVARRLDFEIMLSDWSGGSVWGAGKWGIVRGEGGGGAAAKHRDVSLTDGAPGVQLCLMVNEIHHRSAEGWSANGLDTGTNPSEPDRDFFSCHRGP
jgi:hypothetical protein